jgi:PST family polysaccharide transporter
VKGTNQDKGTLAERASRAFGWSFLNNVVARFSTMGIGVALARLLGPHQFGAFAVSVVALLALLSFNELGVSLAIVRWQDDPREIAPTVTTISVASSLVIYAGCFVAAPYFASAMGSPSATNVIRVLAVNVIIDGLVATPAALMQRYFRQDKKMIADQLNNWVGAGTSIGLAIMHFGAMSLAVGRLAGAVVAAIIFIIFSPQPLRFGYDRAVAGSLFQFGMPLAGASIIVFAVQNVDQIIVGRFLGATALGFYALAFNMSSWPLNIFSMPVRSVAPALFSRLQHDRQAMGKGFLTGIGLLESMTLPVCMVISGAAVPLVHIVYGTSWEPAATALTWLGILAAIRIMYEFIYDFFVVLARSRVVFTVQLVWLIILVPALIVGTKVKGIAGTSMAEVLVALCVVLPWYLAELNRISIRWLAVLARLSLPVIAGVGVYTAAHFLVKVVHSPFSAVGASSAVGLAVMAVLGYRMRGEVLGLRTVMREPSAVRESQAPAGLGTASRADRPGTAVPRPTVTRSRPPWITAPMPATGAAFEVDEVTRSRREQWLADRNRRAMRPPSGHPQPPAGRPQPQWRRVPLPDSNAVPGRPVPSFSPAGRPGQPAVPGRPVPSFSPAGRPGQSGGAGRTPMRQQGRQILAGGRKIASAMVSATAPMPAVRDITGPLELYRDQGAWTPIFQQSVHTRPRNNDSRPRDNGRRKPGGSQEGRPGGWDRR